MAHEQLLAIVAAILVVVGTLPGGAAIATAQTTPEPPSIPAEYYGDVTIDGEPAPEGTTIEAEVNGSVVGSITIDQPGQYGGPEALDETLTVGANGSVENGSEIQFFVNNDEIDRTEVTNTDPETVEWSSGDNRRVDLSAAVEEPLLRVDITDAPDNVTAGNNIPVGLNITNTGVADAENRTVNVSIDGEVRQNFTETLAVGRSTEPTAQVPTNADEAGNVTVTVDTGDRTASTTVEVVPPAEFAVTDLSLDNTAVNATEFVNGSATVENLGNRTDTQNLTVRIGASDTEVENREVVNDTRIELDGGEAQTIDFAYETDAGDVGTRIVTAATDDDANSTAVEVAAQPTFEVNVIESESNLDVVAGENASIVAEIENVGDLAGEQTVTVTREDTDTDIASVDPTLAPGDIVGVDAEFPTPDGADAEINLTVSTPDDSETELVNVTDVGAPSFDVTIDDINDSVDEPLAGNTTNISVDVNVTNLGGEQGTQTINFSVDGDVEETREVNSLSSGESNDLTDVRLPVEPGQTPSVDVAVASENDTATRTVDVNTTAAFDVTVVERSNVTVSDLTTDDAFAPTINVTNTGEQTGNATLRVRFNGSIAKNFSVDSLAAGTTREVVNENNIALNASTDGVKIIEAEAINNATDATDDVATRQVGIGAAPNFTVESVTLSPSGTIPENAALTIDATINNTGDDVGTNETVTIDFGDRQVGATVIEELDDGNDTTVTATVSTRSGDVGTRTITASTSDDSATDTIDVQADAAFTVTNVDASESVIAGENASVDVTVRNDGGVADNSRDIRLFADGDAVATRAGVTLSAGETQVLTFDGGEGVATSEAGDLEVTAATETDAGTDTISVGEPGELDLDVVSLTDPVTNDSTFSASVRATNIGDGQVSETIALRFEAPSGNTPQVDSTTETIDGGNSTIVSLETTLTRSLDSESTTADVTVDAATDSITETVTIEQPPDEPDFRVSNLNAPASVLDTEETVNVTATVTNVGDQQGTQEIELVADSEVRDTNESLQLDGGESASVDLAFNASNVSTGSVDYSINSTNQSAGNTLTVEAADPGVAEVVSTTVLTQSAVQTQPLRVEATVENTGDLNATSETVTLDYLNASGVTDTNTTGVLEPGETTTLTLEVTPPSEPRAGIFDRAVEVRSNVTNVTRTVPVDFEGIQSGIVEADAGETVEIADSTFEPRNEIVVDTAGVELAAADPTDRPTIESPRQSDTLVTVEAEDIRLSDLRIDGDGTGPGVVLDANNTTVRNVRISNTSTGIDEADGTNRITSATVVDAGQGIALNGDGDTTVEFSRVTGTDSQGVAVTSSNNTLRSVEVSDATTGIDIDGAADNRIEASVFGSNDIGIRVADIQASDTNPGARFADSALDSNGVGALIDNTTVNSSGNWWGTPNPQENEEYLVRSGLNLDPADSRTDSQFNVDIGLTGGTDEARGEAVTVPITVTNDGTRLDLQTIELLAGGTVVDSTTVRLGADSQETVELSYTPTIVDGNAVDFTARSLDDTTGVTTVDVPPTDFTVSASIPSSITEGGTLSVSSTVGNVGGVGDTQTVELVVDGTTVDSQSVSLSGLSSATPTLSATPDADAGDTLNVKVQTDDDSASSTVSVNAPEEEDEDPPGGGPTGGDDDGDEPTDVPAPVEEIGAEPTNVESVTPEVDADAGQTVATFETTQNVESIALDTTESVSEVTVSELDPDTETETPAPGQPVSLQDITVSDADSDASDTPATIRFRVSNERLDAAGTAAENLAAFRLVDGDWQRLETSVAEETDTGVVLEAQTPGFSVFAVSAVTPPTGEITLNPETVTAGEAVSLSGAQSTDPDGEIEAYEWSVDGETLTGETVTTSLDAPGEYTVELVVTDDAGETDTVTATLVVEQADTATPGPDTATPEPDVDSPTDGPIEEPGGFGGLTPILVVIVVLLLGAGVAAYRIRE